MRDPEVHPGLLVVVGVLTITLIGALMGQLGRDVFEERTAELCQGHAPGSRPFAECWQRAEREEEAKVRAAMTPSWPGQPRH